MPYGFRVACGMAGGLMLGAGAVDTVSNVARRAFDGFGSAGFLCGVGLALLAAAFVPRD